MTSKLVVNTIEADTGISSVSFASSISMNSTAKFHFSAAGVDIGADTNINRPEAGVLGFNISGNEKVRIDSNGNLNQSGSGNVFHYINTGNNSGDNSTIAFGDSADADAGYINYDHGTNSLQIRTNGGSNSLTIDSSGKASISVNKDSTALVIDGTSSGTYFGETGGRIEFLMNNEVNQFTGNFAARIAPYLDRSNNGFGLKFDVRYNASTTYKALDITADYEVLPGVDATISLGNSSYRWSNIYSADLQLSNVGTGGNEVDGTEGSWTLQEAEDTVYMINRKNGKRYKIKMEEV